MRFSNSFGYAIKRRDAIGRLVPKDNLALLVDPGAQMIDNSDANKPYRPLNLGAEQADNPDFHDFTIDYPSIGEPDPFYESDFSAGTDGWIAYAGTVIGNVDGIDGEDDVLKFWANSDNTSHFPYTWNDADQTRIPPHTIVRVTGKVFIPSGQTNVDGFRIGTTRGIITREVKISTTDTWVDFDAEINNNTDVYALIRFYETTGSTADNTFTGADDPNDDIIYLKDVKFQRVGLVAWWQFDSYYHAQEGTGKTILQDLSGNGYDLTASTGFDWQNQLTGDDPTYKNGNAVEFDGVDDYAYISGAQADAFNSGTGDFSVSVLVKINDLTHINPILYKRDPSGGSFWQVWVGTDGYIYSSIRDTDGTSTKTLVSTTAITTNTWYHITFVYKNADVIKIFINGQLDNSISAGNYNITNNYELRVGRTYSSTYFNGIFAFAAYFNRAISATEVKTLYGKPKYWTWNETGTISNNNFKAELSGGAELSQDITTDDETLYKEQKISTTDNDVDYFGNTTSHTVTIDDGTWSYAGVKDVTNVDAVGSNFVEDFSKGGAVYGDELITNGGFESGTTGELYAYFNTGNGASGTYQTVTDEKHSGSYSVNVNITNSGTDYPDVQVMIPRSDYMQFIEGSVYKIDFWLKVDYDFVNTPYFRAMKAGSPYTWVSETYYITKNTSSNGWQHYVVYFVSTETIDDGTVRLYFGSCGTGNIYLDDFSVKQVFNGNHGLTQGGLETNQPVYPYAWEFDGVDDYVDFGDVLDVGTNPFIFCFWIKTSTTGGTVLSRRQYTDTWYKAGVVSSGKLQFDLVYDYPNNTGNQHIEYLQSNVIINDNSWHFCAIVRDNNKDIWMWIDDELQTSTVNFPESLDDPDANVTFKIGVWGSVYNYFSGKIAPVAIYPFDGQDGRASVMPSNYVDHYIQRIYNRTRKYFGV